MRCRESNGGPEDAAVVREPAARPPAPVGALAGVAIGRPVEQDQYEHLRNEAVRAWDEMKDAAEEEDKLGTGTYLRTEGLLLDLKRLNNEYLKLALPLLNGLLGSTNDSGRSPRPRLEDPRSENWR